MRNNYLKLIGILLLITLVIFTIVSDFVNPFTTSHLSLQERIKYEQMIF